MKLKKHMSTKYTKRFWQAIRFADARKKHEQILRHVTISVITQMKSCKTCLKNCFFS